jgi:hypothetical protein
MDCYICLNIEEGVDVITTVCGHYFHKKCLEKWLCVKRNCPTCRSELRSDVARKLGYDEKIKYIDNEGVLGIIDLVEDFVENADVDTYNKDSSLEDLEEGFNQYMWDYPTYIHFLSDIKELPNIVSSLKLHRYYNKKFNHPDYSITSLEIDYSDLNTLEGMPTELSRLIINCSKLTVLDLKLDCLVYLDVEFNRIKTIINIPECLEFLNISANPISEIDIQHDCLQELTIDNKQKLINVPSSLEVLFIKIYNEKHDCFVDEIIIKSDFILIVLV